MWEQPPLLCRHSFSPGEGHGLLRVQEPDCGRDQTGVHPELKQRLGAAEFPQSQDALWLH